MYTQEEFKKKIKEWLNAEEGYSPVGIWDISDEPESNSVRISVAVNVKVSLGGKEWNQTKNGWTSTERDEEKIHIAVVCLYKQLIERIDDMVNSLTF